MVEEGLKKTSPGLTKNDTFGGPAPLVLDTSFDFHFFLRCHLTYVGKSQVHMKKIILMPITLCSNYIHCNLSRFAGLSKSLMQHDGNGDVCVVKRVEGSLYLPCYLATAAKSSAY